MTHTFECIELANTHTCASSESPVFQSRRVTHQHHNWRQSRHPVRVRRLQGATRGWQELHRADPKQRGMHVRLVCRPLTKPRRLVQNCSLSPCTGVPRAALENRNSRMPGWVRAISGCAVAPNAPLRSVISGCLTLETNCFRPCDRVVHMKDIYIIPSATITYCTRSPFQKPRIHTLPWAPESDRDSLLSLSADNGLSE